MLTNARRLPDLLSNAKLPKTGYRSVMPCFSYRRDDHPTLFADAWINREKAVGNLGAVIEQEIEPYTYFVLDPEKEVLRRLDPEIAHLEPALAAHPEATLP